MRAYEIKNTGGGGGTGGASTSTDVTMTSPVLGADGANVQLVIQSLADNFTQTYVAAETITKYSATALDATGKIILAANNNLEKINFTGFSLANATANSTVKIQDAAELVNLGWISLGAVKGDKAWLDSIPGQITNVLPPIGARLIYCGIFKNATTIKITDLSERRDLGFRKN